jgi:hypothetical protein
MHWRPSSARNYAGQAGLIEVMTDQLSVPTKPSYAEGVPKRKKIDAPAVFRAVL